MAVLVRVLRYDGVAGQRDGAASRAKESGGLAARHSWARWYGPTIALRDGV